MATTYQSGTRVSEYVLESLLGQGTFGQVWKARHHIWDKDRVAIKLPTEPDYVRYLQREGLVVHGLRHANIVRVLGLDPYAETPYLVMELVDGPSLKDVIGQNARGLPLPTVSTVARGVLQALSAAHAANVLHRDLKPGNVLLHLSGQPLDSLRIDAVKLSDFGLGVGGGAEMLRSVAQSASLAKDDRVVGTLAYMAPEVREGHTPADAQSDLYSFGVVLFEMLTGERPAGAELPSALRRDTPTGFDLIFGKLYARRERRYQSADDVLRDMEERLGLQRGPAPPPIPPPMPSATRGGAARRTCAICTGALDATDQFCVHCGAQAAARLRRCPSCRAYPAPFDRYCIHCGAAVIEE